MLARAVPGRNRIAMANRRVRLRSLASRGEETSIRGGGRPAAAPPIAAEASRTGTDSSTPAITSDPGATEDLT